MPRLERALLELGVQQFPFLPVRWMMRDRFESWQYAARVSVPTSVIVAEHDEVIPRRSSEALYEGFRAGVATWRVLDGTSHNTVSQHADYIAALKGQR